MANEADHNGLDIVWFCGVLGFPPPPPPPGDEHGVCVCVCNFFLYDKLRQRNQAKHSGKRSRQLRLLTSGDDGVVTSQRPGGCRGTCTGAAGTCTGVTLSLTHTEVLPRWRFTLKELKCLVKWWCYWAVEGRDDLKVGPSPARSSLSSL